MSLGTDTFSALGFQLSIGGIIILKDTSADMEELVEPVAAHGPKIEEEEQEPEPPEPFEYIDDQDPEVWCSSLAPPLIGRVKTPSIRGPSV